MSSATFASGTLRIVLGQPQYIKKTWREVKSTFNNYQHHKHSICAYNLQIKRYHCLIESVLE